MINDETKRKLREMNLEEIIDFLDIQKSIASYTELTFDERLQTIVDYLYQEKYNDITSGYQKINSQTPSIKCAISISFP